MALFLLEQSNLRPLVKSIVCPKHMLKLMGKKILRILRSNFLFI